MSRLTLTSFWRKFSGNLLSHKQGLTKQQLEFFHKLKEGDRLALMTRRVDKDETAPDYFLKKWEPKENN